jgi:hypothetical protein
LNLLANVANDGNDYEKENNMQSFVNNGSVKVKDEIQVEYNLQKQHIIIYVYKISFVDNIFYIMFMFVKNTDERREVGNKK